MQCFTSSVSGSHDLFLIYTLCHSHGSILVDHNSCEMCLDANRSISDVSSSFYPLFSKSSSFRLYNQCFAKSLTAYPGTTKSSETVTTVQKGLEICFSTPGRRENRNQKLWKREIREKLASRARWGRSGQIRWNEVCTSGPAGDWTVPPSAASLPPRTGV